MVILILILAPAVLFLFKNLLPIIGEGVFTKNFNKKRLAEEAIQLSTDYLFAAISYLLPKIVNLMVLSKEVLTKMSTIDNKIDINILNKQLGEYEQQLNYYYGRIAIIVTVCIVLMILLPFSVFLNKLAISIGDAGEKKIQGIIIVSAILVSLLSLILSVIYL